MKTLSLSLLFGVLFCFSPKTKPTSQLAEMPAAPTLAADSISFAKQIQPILQTHCNPCHFPGGKMYEKMPFDQAKTILEHPEGVLKRFKDEQENKLIQQFFVQGGK